MEKTSVVLRVNENDLVRKIKIERLSHQYAKLKNEEQKFLYLYTLLVLKVLPQKVK
jgi:hypothetical protein